MESEAHRRASSPWFSRLAGIAGISASMVCAVHCMAMPLFSAILLLTGIGFSAQANLELVLMLSSLTLAAVVLVPPAWRGGDPLFLQLAILASAFFLAGWLGIGLSAVMRQSCVITSSALLLMAHAGNFRHLREEALCAHGALHGANSRP